MQKVALTDINAWDVAWPTAAGLGIGLGARLLRHGVDLKSKKGVRAPKTTSPLESAQIEVPVDVSDEEAAALQAQGIKVGADRSVLPAAVATDSTVMPSKRGVTMSPAAKPVVPGATKVGAEGLTSTVLQGALGAGAAYGGWSVLDNILDKQRLEKAKGSLQRSRDRVKRLIAGEPDPSEAGIATALKTAEELFLKQSSIGTSIGSSIIGGATDIMAPIGIPLGIGAALLGAKAYNESKSANKYRQRVKQISDSLEHEDPMAPVAVLHPVRRRKAAPSDTGVIHNPGAEPIASSEIDVKVAAHRGDDDEDSDYGKWIALAIAGLAGAAGLMWVRSNPDVAKQYAPEFLHGAIDWVAGGNEPKPEHKAAANQVVQQAGETYKPTAAENAMYKRPVNPENALPPSPPPIRATDAAKMNPAQLAATNRNRDLAAAAAARGAAATRPGAVAPGQTLTPEDQGAALANAGNAPSLQVPLVPSKPPPAPAPTPAATAPGVLPTEPVATVKPPAPVVPPSPKA
ncbi:MAG TPA: hypothetical protein PLS53_00245 [Thermoanaerobaculaceae bacterium]|nr:hypothetical protein [Thermoanaerobaculaceae bacterium]HPS76563.1 hypothetical protein [Thermoanaerobaculaceae bacterium]